MFLHPARHFDIAAPAVPAVPQGGLLLAGTRVETDRGWRDVTALRAGDRVQTFDGGLRPLAAVERVRLAPDPERLALRIPGGRLGACADLTLLPGCRVLLATGARRPEAARALVAARALRALPGVTSVPMPGAVAAVRPVFADEEVIWANTGVLIHCPGPDGSDQFPALAAAEAHALVARQATRMLAA